MIRLILHEIVWTVRALIGAARDGIAWNDQLKRLGAAARDFKPEPEDFR